LADDPMPTDLKPRRAARLIAVRARLRAIEFDRALAAGVDPLTTPAIAARAEVLRSRREREGLASAIYLALRDASRGTSPFSTRVPVAREAVRRCRPELLALAAQLRQAADVSARGVAAVRLLVTDGAGPLYCDVGYPALRAAVLRATAWLDGGPPLQPSPGRPPLTS
jgi:hypothetical protein